MQDISFVVSKWLLPDQLPSPCCAVWAVLVPLTGCWSWDPPFVAAAPSSGSKHAFTAAILFSNSLLCYRFILGLKTIFMMFRIEFNTVLCWNQSVSLRSYMTRFDSFLYLPLDRSAVSLRPLSSCILVANSWNVLYTQQSLLFVWQTQR